MVNYKLRMGKTKHNKRKDRHKPTGMISVQEAKAKESECDVLESKTLPILEKLNCLEDREHACAGLANLVLEPDAIMSLMKHRIVRRVAPLILDKDEAVQEAATGVLRNLSISSEPSICQMMIDQDVMTPVVIYIREFSEHLLNSHESHDVIKQQSCVHEQLMHLLLNLCENASKTITIANEECIIPILTTFLNADILPVANVLVTAQCLCTITEDNHPAGEALVNSNNSVAILEKNVLCDDESRKMMLIKVFAAGTLFNICQSLPSHKAFEMFQAIATVFAKVLDNDIFQSVERLNERIKAHKESQTVNGCLENGENSEEKRLVMIDQEIQQFQQILEAQKITLEILTNMCCSDESLDEDCEGYSSDDIEEDCSVQQHMDLDMDSSHLFEEIITSVVSQKLPKKVLQKCSFVDLNDSDGVMATERMAGCRKIIETIQTRALVCLNNILSTIDVDQLGGPEAMTHLWTKIMDIAFQNNGSASGFSRSDDEFVVAASGALRSVLERLASTKRQQCVTDEQVSLLCHLTCVVKLEAARVNLMNVLGIVGKIIIASSTDEIEPLQCIGTVLRDVVVSGESLWVIAEALDAIYDIFADSPSADIAASNIALLSHLERTVSVLKSRVRKERQTLGDRVPIVNTARTNLVRFLKYKKQKN